MFQMLLVLLRPVTEITKENPSVVSDVLPIYIFFFADILGSLQFYQMSSFERLLKIYPAGLLSYLWNFLVLSQFNFLS
jgi:hypothetical protein